MTKLFSMKRVVFAGAAALALTLAAAPSPQADAAEEGTVGIEVVTQKEILGEPITEEQFLDLVKKGDEKYKDYGYAMVVDGKITNYHGYDTKYNYKTGTRDYFKVIGKENSVDEDDGCTTVNVSKSAITVANRKLTYYYSVAKAGKEPKKWKAASTDDYCGVGDYDDEGNYIKNDSYAFNVPVNEIAKGKTVDVYIAADAQGTVKTTKIACTKDPKEPRTPKLKATLLNLSSGPSISVKLKGSEPTEGYINVCSSYGCFETYSIDVKDLPTGSDTGLMNVLQRAADFGGTTMFVDYYTISEDGYDDDVHAGTGKFKVSATPKAPKLSLKLAKAFSLKIKNTMKYRAFLEDKDEIWGSEYKTLSDAEKANYEKTYTDLYEETDDYDRYSIKWKEGSNTKMTMDELFGSTNVRAIDGLSGEYVLNDTMIIQAKTFDKKGKKTDSNVASFTVYQSPATPSAVNAEITNKTTTNKKGVTTTGASIKFDTTGLALTQDTAAPVSGGAVVTLQYRSDSDKKWKDVKTTKPTVEYKSGKIPKEIYVRIKGVDYKAANAKKNTKATYYEAPGQVMKVVLDENDPAGQSKYVTTASAIGLTKAEFDEEAKKEAK